MIERYIIFIYFKGLPVSLLSMLLALSGAGVLAAGVILKSNMGKKKESEFFQNLSDEITTEWRYYLEMSYPLAPHFGGHRRTQKLFVVHKP